MSAGTATLKPKQQPPKIEEIKNACAEMTGQEIFNLKQFQIHSESHKNGAAAITAEAAQAQTAEAEDKKKRKIQGRAHAGCLMENIKNPVNVAFFDAETYNLHNPENVALESNSSFWDWFQGNPEEFKLMVRDPETNEMRAATHKEKLVIEKNSNACTAGKSEEELFIKKIKNGETPSPEDIPATFKDRYGAGNPPTVGELEDILAKEAPGYIPTSGIELGGETRIPQSTSAAKEITGLDTGQGYLANMTTSIQNTFYNAVDAVREYIPDISSPKPELAASGQKPEMQVQPAPPAGM
ncbi:MAG: hypothetical protein MRY79_00695 [Alphaproteobacteria bacterium]|nr:hypothetical protein [Alphaproteobacteria bacterium]